MRVRPVITASAWDPRNPTNVWLYIMQLCNPIIILDIIADLVLSSVLWSLLVIFSMALCLLLGGSRSILFRTTTMRGQVSSPISRHSAVWVCTPFTTSTTSIIRSMIWAPRGGRCHRGQRKVVSWRGTMQCFVLKAFQLSCSIKRCKCLEAM